MGIGNSELPHFWVGFFDIDKLPSCFVKIGIGTVDFPIEGENKLFVLVGSDHFPDLPLVLIIAMIGHSASTAMFSLTESAE